LIRLPLTADCRTMCEARVAGKAGPPARQVTSLLLARCEAVFPPL